MVKNLGWFHMWVWDEKARYWEKTNDGEPIFRALYAHKITGDVRVVTWRPTNYTIEGENND